MGVIQRQGIKQTAAFLLGAIIGGINNLIIFPAAFAPNQIGLIRLFQDLAILVAPFLLMGTSGLTVRFFPKFQNKNNGHNGFMTLLLSAISLGILIFLFLSFGLQDFIIDRYQESSPLFGEYYFFILPITIAYGLTAFFNQYSSNFLRLTVPAIISQSTKPIMALIAIAYMWHWVTFRQVVTVFSTWYVVSLILLILYIKYLGQLTWKPNWGFLNKPLLKELGNYALFGVLASAGSNFIYKLDTLMLSTMTDLAQTGIYTIAAYIASVIMIPTNSLISIASPIISNAWHENNLDEIKTIYKKASLNLSIIGLLYILLVFGSIHDLFDFMPNGSIYQVGVPVIFILLASHFFNMVTSVNTEIIGYSTYYRINFYSIMLAGLLNIALNYLLIPKYNLLGPAIATTISLFFFNVFKLVFIYKKYGIHPFGKGSLTIFIIALFTFPFTFLPIQTGIPLINIALKSTVIVFVFVLLTIRWKVSPELNKIYNDLLKKIGRKG